MDNKLIAIGNALYGYQWQSDLARALGYRDARNVRHWVRGTKPVPVSVWPRLAELMQQRQDVLAKLSEEITNGK